MLMTSPPRRVKVAPPRAPESRSRVPPQRFEGTHRSGSAPASSRTMDAWTAVHDVCWDVANVSGPGAVSPAVVSDRVHLGRSPTAREPGLGPGSASTLLARPPREAPSRDGHEDNGAGCGGGEGVPGDAGMAGPHEVRHARGQRRG